METNEIKSALDAIQGEVQDFIKKTNETVEQTGKMTSEQKDEMQKLEEKAADLEARLADVEQKGSNSQQEEKSGSVGEQFVKSELFEQFKAGGQSKISFEVKNTIVGSDVTVAPDRMSGVIGGSFRALRIADVLPSGSTNSNSVEFTRENVFTNNAAETAENTAKPQSDITFTLENAPVRTIAHWLKVTTQMVEDSPALVAFINNRLTYGVEHRFDSQLINGNGTGANISGLLNAGNYTAFTPGAGVSALDNIRKAITQVQLADYNPNAVVMNPSDVESIDLTKATDGAFVASNPRMGVGATVWGLPIVTSNAVAANKFLLGAFDMSCQVFNRTGTVIQMFEQDDTNVQSNLVTIRAEKRAALAIYRPASIIGGALTA